MLTQHGRTGRGADESKHNEHTDMPRYAGTSAAGCKDGQRGDEARVVSDEL